MRLTFLAILAVLISSCSEKNTSVPLKNESNETILNREYKEVIQEADAYFDMQEIQSIFKAKDLYNRAILMKPAEVYPRDRVAECDGRIQEYDNQKKINSQCDDLLMHANKYFDEKKYTKAKSLYQRMLTDCRGKTEYASTQIEKINKILSE